VVLLAARLHAYNTPTPTETTYLHTDLQILKIKLQILQILPILPYKPTNYTPLHDHPTTATDKLLRGVVAFCHRYNVMRCDVRWRIGWI